MHGRNLLLERPAATTYSPLFLTRSRCSPTEHEADIVMYDVGPNVGPLNRAVLLDCDYFITPVASDLFSLRALSTVGIAASKWIRDFKTVRELADSAGKARLPAGKPIYLGYLSSAFKVNIGRRASNPHEEWERKIAPRVKAKVVDQLASVDKELVDTPPHKIGDVEHYQSLAPEGQKYGLAIGRLKGRVNPGYNQKIDDAAGTFGGLANVIVKRIGIERT